jgi:hypothetical protein
VAFDATLVAGSMANTLGLSARDESLLRLLCWTPATTALLLRASSTFEGGGFNDERRLRERMQRLSQLGFVRSWSTAHAGGGLMNYYKLTPAGYTHVYGGDVESPPRTFFGEVSPSLFEHTFRLAEAIVETVRAGYARRVTIERFYRENELAFAVGNGEIRPDCFFRLSSGGRYFNLAFEIDQSTESVDSAAVSSIRSKLLAYHAYQEFVLEQWRSVGKAWEKPRLRVVFLTRTVERAYHILSLARETNPTPRRRLVYAAMQASYVSDPDPLHAPLFLDHHGHWQSLIDLHPIASHQRARVQIVSATDSWPLFG